MKKSFRCKFCKKELIEDRDAIFQLSKTVMCFKCWKREKIGSTKK